jgi:predicted AlkP superfamily pyrophosphatase or phosphodiesterase
MHPRFFVLAASILWLLTCVPGLIGVASAASPALILVSIDGYRADYIERGNSPVLSKLAAEGVHAKALRPVFPSITFPNHYTLVTGLYPDHHGIVNNTMHDAALGDFTAGGPSNADGRWWDQAEPIWVTAEKHGLRTAAMFWPGTQAEIHGGRPTYWRPFDSSVTPDARADQVLAWLDLPQEKRPAFMTLYFNQVDSAGHSYGPDSLQVNESLVTVDAALGKLVDGLRQRDLLDSTNLVLVSDHGMAASSPERLVLLDQLTNLEHLDLVSSLVNIGINPKPGYEREVEHALVGRHAHLTCWNRKRIPARYHYGANPRIPLIQCVTDTGWMAVTAAEAAKVKHPVLGEHGYDNNDPQMRALFIAHGPSFKQHIEVPEFDNIQVYALLAAAMGIRPLPNDGKLSATMGVLRTPR